MPPIARLRHPSEHAVAYGLLAVAAVLFAGYAGHAQFDWGGHVLDGLFQKWVNDAVVFVCAFVTALRARSHRRERTAWLLLSLGMVSWAVGNVYYSVFLIDRNPLPIPSVADGLWLGIYPFTYLGIVLLVRTRLSTWRTSMWLDGVIAAAAVAAVSADVVVSAVLGSSAGSSTAELVTNLAYPIGDLVLLGMVIGAIALEGWHADRAWLCLAAGFGAFTVTDGLFLVKTVDGTYQVGTIIDAGWLLCALLVAHAAWQPTAARQRLHADGWRFVIMPSACALIAVALLVRDSTEYVIRPWTAAMAALTLIGVIARYGLTFREYMLMVRHSRGEASTDPLTGLGNRRALLDDLDASVQTDGGRPFVLGLFDLDGFKAYNDAYGHPAGDALLTRLGARLAAAVGDAGSAYRMGGDEFCVIVPCAPGAGPTVVAGAAAAMGDTGEGFSVRASFGAVELPAESTDTIDALRTADQRMYAQKRARGAATGKEISQTLIQALTEHAPGWDEHMSTVADLAVAVAQELGLQQEEVVDVRRAAELHDIGKIAVPAAILEKPGPLSEEEWTFVRRHTLIGERILQAAPTLNRAATLIRSSHERWDGAGYPDGLRGQEIPLGARIITVCDSYDAMIAERSYHGAMTPQAALDELRRCAGTQFDPQVVAAFCRVHGRLRPDALAA